MDKRRVIVDVDTGVDDCLALIILLHADRKGLLQIEAITCTAGNTSLENVCKNTVRILEMLGRTDIPIFKGCKQPLIPHSEKLPFYHGNDGFGDLVYDVHPDLSVISDIPAAIAIRNIVIKYPKLVSLICLGPLTNVALAVKLHEDISSNLKDIWIMGGNYFENEAVPQPEFNFLSDPEAAKIVLSTLTCPVYLFPWETCEKSSIPLEWKNETLKPKSAAMELLVKAEDIVYSMNEQVYNPCDAFLAFTYINPEKNAIQFVNTYDVDIESHSTSNRGGVLLQQSKKEPNNITFITEIDLELFKQFLQEIHASF